MPSSRLTAGIAAGHPDTAAAGHEILAEGGTAADAAVAAVLASCVAETVMTGLAGGAHALYWDAHNGTAHVLDGFVAIPGLGAEGVQGRRQELDILFGSQAVRYEVGAGTCGVPGTPAACDALMRRWGRLPWERVIEPARRLAARGVALPPTHAAVLEMLAPVMTMDAGARIYAPAGRLLRGGDRLRQPGLERLLDVVAQEGPRTFYEGTVAQALLGAMRERGGLVTHDDLVAYSVRWGDPEGVALAGRRVLARRDHSDLLATLAALPSLEGAAPGARAVALARALAGRHGLAGTSAIAVADAAGSACAVVTSLGLGAGDWVATYDLHLNSMLGEVDLVTDDVAPGDRLASNMVPVLALDARGPEVIGGAAGGTRIRTALVHVLVGLLQERRAPAEAVLAPRLHPLDDLVHAEPGLAEEAFQALEADGFRVVRWPARHHYFGGANVVTRAGPAADPRRDGRAIAL